MRKALKNLAGCQAGTAALEFALALPVVLVLVTGAIEFAIMSFTSALLEGGLREAARYGITGSNPDSGTREQEIVRIVNEHAAGLFTITTANVDTKVYTDFSSIGQPEPYTDENGNDEYDLGEPFTDVNCNSQWDEDMGLAGAGGGNEIVLYTINHQFNTLTGFLDPIIAPSGSVAMQASVAVKNEPFPGSATVCSGSS